MPNHIIKGLVKNLTKKNAGEAIAPVARQLSGPLQPDKVIAGKTYKPKPTKVKNKLDKVQHEANVVDYINTKGDRKTGSLNFADDQGNTSYLNKSGDNMQYTDLRTKGGNNSKLQDRRGVDAEVQTRPDIDQTRFYKEAEPGTEAHHIAGLDQYGWLFDGLDSGDQAAMIGLLEKIGIFTGNNPANRADLPKQVHTALHSWMKKKGFVGREKASIAHLSFDERLGFVNQLKTEYDETMKEMYTMMTKERASKDEFHNAFVSQFQPEMVGFDFPSTTVKEAA